MFLAASPRPKLMRLSGLESGEPGYITGDELVSYFFRFPTYPKILGIDAVKQAIVKAVQQGLIGYVSLPDYGFQQQPQSRKSLPR